MSGSEFRETFRVGVPWSRFYSQMWSGFGFAWFLYRHSARSVEIRARRLLVLIRFGCGRRGDERWRTLHIGADVTWFDPQDFTPSNDQRRDALPAKSARPGSDKKGR